MRPRTQPRQRLTLAVACTAQVMMVLDVMIVSVALPALQRELHLSPAGLEWVVSAYALALAALIPAGGALGDHFGRRRVFMSGVALFMLASVGCALSDAGGILMLMPVIQGIGGAVMSSLTLSLITEAYPPEARTGPIGLWAAVSGLAVAGGSGGGGIGRLLVRGGGGPGTGTAPLRHRRRGAERFRTSVADLRVRRLLRRDLAFTGGGRGRRRGGGGSGGLLRVGAQGGIPHGPAGVAANPELRPGLCRVPAGLPRVLGIHLLRHPLLSEC